MPKKPGQAPLPAKSAPPANVTGPWLRRLVLLLSAIVLFNWFYKPIGLSDFWWHLKTGEFIWQHHTLPAPDHFAFTTYLNPPAYPGEELVRYFNLTHEWLAQTIWYLVYSAAGFAGIIVFRQLLLGGLCAIIGLVVYRRCGGFYRAIGAALAVAAVSSVIAEDRPYLLGYLLLGVTFWIMESRRRLWLLPPMFLFWANCHSAFFLGWMVMGAYCAEALWMRWRGKPESGERQLFLVTAASVLASGINPNGFRVFQILELYRHSTLQMSLLEWQRPKYWELSAFTVVLYGSLAVLLWARRRVRLADWLLYIAFALAALGAVRNIVLLGIIGAIVIFSYLPGKFAPPAFADALAAALLAVACWFTLPYPPLYGLQTWSLPIGAADFLESHHIHGRMLNTYGDGGYLMWRLGPSQQVFIDGRALNETAAGDLRRMLYNADSTGGPSGAQLLDKYGIDLIVVPVLDEFGSVYNLAVSLADPAQKTWKLIYRDAQSVIFVRNPPPGVQPLNPLETLSAMQMQCQTMLENSKFAGCAQSVSQVFSVIGDGARAAQWMNIYRQHAGEADSPLTVK